MTLDSPSARYALSIWHGGLLAAVVLLLAAQHASRGSTAAARDAPRAHGQLEPAALSDPLQPIDQAGGELSSLVVVEDHLYLGHGARLHAFVVTTPVSPTRVWASKPYRDRVYQIVVDERRNELYVAAGLEGALLYDVSEPSQPRRLARIRVPGHAVTAIAGVGNGDYLVQAAPADQPHAALATTVWLVDSDAPAGAAPWHVEMLDGSRCLAVEDDRLYMVRATEVANGELSVFDIQAPRFPSRVGTVDGVTVTNCELQLRDHLFISGDEVHIYDFRRQDTPIHLAEIPSAGAAHVAVRNQTLFVTQATVIRSYNISDPREPAPLQTALLGPPLPLRGAGAIGAGDLVLSEDGHWLFSAGIRDRGQPKEGGQLFVHDVRDPSDMTRQHATALVAPISNVANFAGFVVTLDTRGVLHVYVETSSGIQRRGSIQVAPRAGLGFNDNRLSVLAAGDGHAFVTEDEWAYPASGTLHAVDLRQPDQPVIVRSATISPITSAETALTRRIALAGDRLLVEIVHDDYRLRDARQPIEVWNVADPARMARYATVYGTLPLGDITTDSMAGLRLDRPGVYARLHFVTHFPETGPLEISTGALIAADYMAITDTHAFLADYDIPGVEPEPEPGLAVVEIGAQPVPELVATLPMTDTGMMSVLGNRLFMASKLALHVIDITDPEAPALIASHPIPHSRGEAWREVPFRVQLDWAPQDLAVTASRIYLADQEAGLLVYRNDYVPTPSAPSPTPPPTRPTVTPTATSTSAARTPSPTPPPATSTPSTTRTPTATATQAAATPAPLALPLVLDSARLR